MCNEPTCNGIAFSFSVNGNRFVMCNYNYNKHRLKRRELEEQFFRKLMKESIGYPDHIYKDLDLKHKGRFCYYKKHYQVGSRIVYTKTIIGILEQPIAIISGYKTDFIKEQKFAKPVICDPLNTK